MVLFILIIIASFVTGFLSWFLEEEIEYFFWGLMLAGIVSFVPFTIVQGIGQANEPTHNVTYSQPIVSISDGKGIDGQISGGFFLISGYVNDTQEFAYYRLTAPNRYVLEKRNADASTIHTDTDASAAHVDITDTIAHCVPHWWLICKGVGDTQTFSHADFHVPQNSIQNSFNLDTK